MRILLFVSSHCPHCPNAERVVKKVVPEYYDYQVTLSKVRVKTSEGKELSLKYNIRSLPTILISDDNGNEIKRIVGVPSENGLKDIIEKKLGLKKSFFSKFFSG